MAAIRHLGFAGRVFWTTHCEYLVVFVIVQNLVGISAVFGALLQATSRVPGGG